MHTGASRTHTHAGHKDALSLWISSSAQNETVWRVHRPPSAESQGPPPPPPPEPYLDSQNGPMCKDTGSMPRHTKASLPWGPAWEHLPRGGTHTHTHIPHGPPRIRRDVDPCPGETWGGRKLATLPRRQLPPYTGTSGKPPHLFFTDPRLKPEATPPSDPLRDTQAHHPPQQHPHAWHTALCPSQPPSVTPHPPHPERKTAPTPPPHPGAGGRQPPPQSLRLTRGRWAAGRAVLGGGRETPQAADSAHRGRHLACLRARSNEGEAARGLGSAVPAPPEAARGSACPPRSRRFPLPSFSSAHRDVSDVSHSLRARGAGGEAGERGQGAAEWAESLRRAGRRPGRWGGSGALPEWRRGGRWWRRCEGGVLGAGGGEWAAWWGGGGAAEVVWGMCPCPGVPGGVREV